jgi:hypothetical protein
VSSFLGGVSAKAARFLQTLLGGQVQGFDGPVLGVARVRTALTSTRNGSVVRCCSGRADITDTKAAELQGEARESTGVVVQLRNLGQLFQEVAGPFVECLECFACLRRVVRPREVVYLRRSACGQHRELVLPGQLANKLEERREVLHLAQDGLADRVGMSNERSKDADAAVRGDHALFDGGQFVAGPAHPKGFGLRAVDLDTDQLQHPRELVIRFDAFTGRAGERDVVHVCPNTYAGERRSERCEEGVERHAEEQRGECGPLTNSFRADDSLGDVSTLEHGTLAVL